MAELPRTVGPWFVVRELGSGGQGVVYLVRSPERHEQIEQARVDISNALIPVTVSTIDDRLARASKLAESIAAISRKDESHELGAGKTYKIPDGPLADKAIARLKVEFDVLRAAASPNILRLLHGDLDSRLMITEYHPGGTLADDASRFKGKTVEALEAFRGLTQAVSELHQRGIVHRDIKLVNVFIAGDRRLVLGDFGIVFVEGATGRLTDTLERVGTRDWMPPWAHTGTRIDDVKPSFDVFTLGKLLWTMLAGRSFLPFWWWNRDEYNLVKIFPDATGMDMVNELILRRTVVEAEGNCLTSATELLPVIDDLLSTLRRHGSRVGEDVIRCRICARGNYTRWFDREANRLLPLPARRSDQQIMIANFVDLLGVHNTMTVRVMRCEVCGHIEFFHFKDGDTPIAWRS